MYIEILPIKIFYGLIGTIHCLPRHINWIHCSAKIRHVGTVGALRGIHITVCVNEIIRKPLTIGLYGN